MRLLSISYTLYSGYKYKFGVFEQKKQKQLFVSLIINLIKLSIYKLAH